VFALISSPAVTAGQAAPHRPIPVADRNWRIDDLSGFEAERAQLLNAVEPAATLLQLTLAGITSLGDRIAVLSRLEHDVAHQLRYLDVRADDLAARPSEDDIAALAVEGMLGVAARKLNAMIEDGGAKRPTGQACARAALR